jgi:hypothetical protein
MVRIRRPPIADPFSVKDTSVCIADGTGKIVREVKVASEPGVLLAVLTQAVYRFKVMTCSRYNVPHLSRRE